MSYSSYYGPYGHGLTPEEIQGTLVQKSAPYSTEKVYYLKSGNKYKPFGHYVDSGDGWHNFEKGFVHLSHNIYECENRNFILK